MSVSGRRNPAFLFGSLVTVALIALAFAVSRSGSASPDDQQSATIVRAPAELFTAIRSDSRAEAAVETSQALFSESATVVVADAADPIAQQTAMDAAAFLGVPVLLDDDSTAAEVSRLKAGLVLTCGKTRPLPGARALSVDPDRAAEQLRAIRGLDRPVTHMIDALALTTSASHDDPAAANARIAGAAVIEVDHPDPRLSPSVIHRLAHRPDTAVLAIGPEFTNATGYGAAVVRGGVEQPTGGYFALGGKRYAALYGHPGAAQLGVLGEQGVKASITRAERLAESYRTVSGADFIPTFEIIATVASAEAGEDNNYSTESSIKALTPLVDAAGKAGIYVILDLQPGRTDFLTQAKQYRPLLERPHVGLALDPEWRLTKDEQHLRQIGSVSSAEINRTSAWLAELTRTKVLPQKLFILHQFTPTMVTKRGNLNTSHPELATVIHVDGSGAQPDKQATWRTLRHGAPEGIGWGWKNFIDEDAPTLTPTQTWKQVSPKPDLVTYQ